MDRNPFLLMPTAIIIHKDSGIKEFRVGLSLFWHMAFRKETFRQKHFGTIDVLACVPIVPTDVPAHGHFVSVDVSARGYFGTIDILAWRHYGTETFWLRDIFAQGPKCPCAEIAILLCMVPKYNCAEMAQCCNVSVPELQWYQNIPMQKHHGDLMFLCRNI